MITMTSRTVKAVALLASVSVVASCGLPRPGPNKREIYSGSVLQEGDAFIVSVNDRVTRATAVTPALGFSNDFKNAGVLGSDTIRPGDTLGLTIWDWISGPSIALMAIMIMNTWTTIGTMMVIFLAALQNVPGYVYEAAQIDGASAWRQFRSITLPLLLVVTEGGLAAITGDWGVSDLILDKAGPAEFDARIRLLLSSNDSDGLIQAGGIVIEQRWPMPYVIGEVLHTLQTGRFDFSCLDAQ